MPPMPKLRIHRLPLVPSFRVSKAPELGLCGRASHLVRRGVMLRWFHALMPKEERFFDLFASHSKTVVAGAEALRALLDGGEAVPTHYRTVMDREHDADVITRDVLIAVRRTFITPFDRGDIKDLITSMDHCIDQMPKPDK